MTETNVSLENTITTLLSGKKYATLRDILVIMQSAREAACLRILGVTKKRARCMLIFGQVLLCAAAIALVTLGLALFGKTLFTRSIETLARCLALYFSGCVCGAVLAAIQVTGRKCLELLQIKE